MECAKDGGILAKGGSGKGKACCPASCKQCGGKNCGQAPGGKHDCCSGEIIAAGKLCSSHPPPCVAD